MDARARIDQFKKSLKGQNSTNNECSSTKHVQKVAEKSAKEYSTELFKVGDLVFGKSEKKVDNSEEAAEKSRKRVLELFRKSNKQSLVQKSKKKRKGNKQESKLFEELHFENENENMVSKMLRFTNLGIFKRGKRSKKFSLKPSSSTNREKQKEKNEVPGETQNKNIGGGAPVEQEECKIKLMLEQYGSFIDELKENIKAKIGCGYPSAQKITRNEKYSTSIEKVCKEIIMDSQLLLNLVSFEERQCKLTRLNMKKILSRIDDLAKVSKTTKAASKLRPLSNTDLINTHKRIKFKTEPSFRETIKFDILEKRGYDPRTSIDLFTDEWFKSESSQLNEREYQRMDRDFFKSIQSIDLYCDEMNEESFARNDYIINDLSIDLSPIENNSCDILDETQNDDLMEISSQADSQQTKIKLRLSPNII